MPLQVLKLLTKFSELLNQQEQGIEMTDLFLQPAVVAAILFFGVKKRVGLFMHAFHGTCTP
jgi:hypothetical protein